MNELWIEVQTVVESGSVEEVKKLYMSNRQALEYCKGGDSSGNILHLSSEKGKTAIVQYIVEERVFHVDAQDGNGNTALLLACREGHTDLVRYLRQHGAKVPRHAVYMAAKNGYTNTLRCLVKEFGANASAFDVAGSRSLSSTKPKSTALHLASVFGHVDVVRCLLFELGADYKAGYGQGDTPLYRTVKEGKNIPKIVQIYLQHGKECGEY